MCRLKTVSEKHIFFLKLFIFDTLRKIEDLCGRLENYSGSNSNPVRIKHSPCQHP